MKKKKQSKGGPSRRNFLNKGMYLGAGVLTGATGLFEDPEKVKMLTPDGKVVMVDKKQVTKKAGKTKNADILDWMENPGITKNKKS